MRAEPGDQDGQVGWQPLSGSAASPHTPAALVDLPAPQPDPWPMVLMLSSDMRSFKFFFKFLFVCLFYHLFICGVEV